MSKFLAIRPLAYDYSKDVKFYSNRPIVERKCLNGYDEVHSYQGIDIGDVIDMDTDAVLIMAYTFKGKYCSPIPIIKWVRYTEDNGWQYGMLHRTKFKPFAEERADKILCDEMSALSGDLGTNVSQVFVDKLFEMLADLLTKKQVMLGKCAADILDTCGNENALVMDYTIQDAHVYMLTDRKPKYNLVYMQNARKEMQVSIPYDPSVDKVVPFIYASCCDDAWDEDGTRISEISIRIIFELYYQNGTSWCREARLLQQTVNGKVDADQRDNLSLISDIDMYIEEEWKSWVDNNYDFDMRHFENIWEIILQMFREAIVCQGINCKIEDWGIGDDPHLKPVIVEE